MHIPAIGHTFARSFMPQIDDIPDFLSSLKEKGVNTSLKTLDPNDLKSTQLDFDANKVFKNMQDKGERKPIITSNDGYVLDGHHRWLEAANKQEKVEAHVCDCPILDLLHHAKRYTHQSIGLNEDIDHKTFGPMLDSFVSFASEKLGIKSLPNIRYKDDTDHYNSFAAYHPGNKDISITVAGRHPMDVFRSLAHELVHHSQNEYNRLYDGAGETGSPIEDEANYMAGRIMRLYAKSNPSFFSLRPIQEAIFVVGGPCSGKDRMAKKLAEQYSYGEIDVQSIVSEQSPGWNFAKDIIVNASADQLNLIEEAQIILEQAFGYTTTLLFVDTSNEISKLRNEARAEKGQRVLNEGLRFEKYTQAQKNKTLLAEMFERDFHVIDNSIQEATSAKGAQNVNVRIKIDGPKDKPKKTASTKKATATSSKTKVKPVKKSPEQIKMDMEAQKQRYTEKNEKSKQKFTQDSEDKKLAHERETQAREAKSLHYQNRAREFQVKIETIRNAMMRLQPQGSNFNKIHKMLKKQMGGAILGLRKYQKSSFDLHQVDKPTETKPEDKSLNENFEEMTEAWKLEKYSSPRFGNRIFADNHKEIDGRQVHLGITKVPETGKATANFEVDGSPTKEKKGSDKIVRHVGKSIDSYVRHMKPTEFHMGANSDRKEQLYNAFAKKMSKKHPNTNFVVKRVTEEGGAGEWGTDELRANYQVQTPGQPVVSFKKNEKPEKPLDASGDVVPQDVLGQTMPNGLPAWPGSGTGIGGYSGMAEHVQKWAMNEKTIERFKDRYGNLWEQKILETAVFLDKQKIEDKPRTLRKIQESIDKGVGDMSMIANQGKDEVTPVEEGGNDTFLNNKSKKIIKRKQ